MGNSVSSCCSDESMKQRVVLVMMEDGKSLIKFKEATPVKDVLAAYPFHKIVRCCSERTVVPRSSLLSCNSLYFLLPEGLALSDATYQRLVRSAASRRLISNEVADQKVDDDDEKPKQVKTGCGDHDQNGPVKVVSSYEEYGFGYKWKPLLKTIPEIASPPVHTNVRVFG